MVASSLRHWARTASRYTLVLTVAALLLAGFVATLYAGADDSPQGPDAPGTISGTVTDSNGAPVAGVKAFLYWADIRLYPQLAQSATTNAAGHYVFGLLGPGIYQIRFVDPQGKLASVYYSGAASAGEATTILVAGNNITGIDARLPLAGHITGTVRFASGIEPFYSEIELYHEEPVRGWNGIGPPMWQRIDLITGDADYSSFQFGGLLDGAYRVCATAYNIVEGFYECFDDALSVAGATDVTVTQGITHGGIAIVLGENSHFSQITGTVTAATGAGLAGIRADLYARYGDYWYPTYIYTNTNPSGDFKFTHVISGVYTVYFDDPSDTYGFQYYGGATASQRATEIHLTDMVTQGNINAELVAAARITGHVTVLGQSPAPNLQVVAYPVVENFYSGVIEGQADPQTGAYNLGGLAAGAYLVCANANSTDSYYSGCYGGNVETGTRITVTIGETRRQINFDLEGGATYNGGISGVVMADGAPLPAIKVNLYTHACCGIAQPLVYTSTDGQGRYTFSGMTTGTYYLGFTDPDGLFATSYYIDAPSLLTSLPIYLTDTEMVSAMTTTLEYGGAISGSVHLRTGAPVAQLVVTAFGQSEGEYPLDQFVSSTSTAADGGFTLRGLKPGVYAVCFANFLTQYPQECYSSFENYAGNIVSVSVEAGQVTSGIEQIWGPDLTSYLPVIGN